MIFLVISERATHHTLSTGTLAVGVAVGLVVVGGIWKASGLRSEQVSRWKDQIEVIQAGLDEQASQRLIEVHKSLTAVLPLAKDDSARFDPTKVLFDPRELEQSMRQFFILLRARQRLASHFRKLLWTGPILFCLLICFLMALTGFTCYISGLDTFRGLGYAGLVVCCFCIALCAVTVGHYFYRQQQLTKSELLSTGIFN